MNSSTGMPSRPTSAQRRSAISAKGNGLMHMNEEEKKNPWGMRGVTRVLQSLVIMTMCSGDIAAEELHRGRCVSAESALLQIWYLGDTLLLTKCSEKGKVLG